MSSILFLKKKRRIGNSKSTTNACDRVYGGTKIKAFTSTVYRVFRKRFMKVSK
jgi:hypothetical protein